VLCGRGSLGLGAWLPFIIDLKKTHTMERDKHRVAAGSFLTSGQPFLSTSYKTYFYRQFLSLNGNKKYPCFSRQFRIRIDFILNRR
jgi:hypothetical protein